MPVGQLDVEYREGTGKGPARRLRARGKIPGICYGSGTDPIPIALDAKALLKCLDPQKKRNTVITLNVQGKEGLSELLVLLRDYQFNPLTKAIDHADFVRIHLDQEVRVTVPIELVGKPEGVKVGGLLNVVYRHLEVAAKPNAIPSKITVNIDALQIGDAIHVSDLKLDPGVRILVEGGTAIASVVAPKVEKEETAAEAAPAAAEGAAAGAAAPAAGAPAAAAGGAAAKPAPGAAAKPAEKKEAKK